jgi:hypothetical protein
MDTRIDIPSFSSGPSKPALIRKSNTDHHQLRSARARPDGESINLKDLTDHLAPANNAHLDQEPSTAVKLVYRTLPAEADQLLQGRFRIIKYLSPLQAVTWNLTPTASGGPCITPWKTGHWPSVMGVLFPMTIFWRRTSCARTSRRMLGPTCSRCIDRNVAGITCQSRGRMRCGFSSSLTRMRWCRRDVRILPRLRGWRRC